jgi:hypothetical protein
VPQRIDRRRTRIGSTDDACSACGHEGMELMESSRVMAGAGPARRLRGRRTRRYLRCPECGTRAPTGAPGPERTPSPVATTVGWLFVAILALVVVGLTAVLAGMLVLISLPLALGTVAVVALAVAGLVWNARRSPRRS